MPSGVWLPAALLQHHSQADLKPLINQPPSLFSLAPLAQAEVGDPHRDAGYWGTSRMALEAALCLALQQKELDASPDVQRGGVLTPASGT